jgi:hypothetical protein
MTTDSGGSGLGSDLSPYVDDGTRPAQADRSGSALSDYLLSKVDQGLDSIKSDVVEIKHKINFDYKMVASDIATGVLSSLLVSVLILFVSENIGQQSVTVAGLTLPVFVLFCLTIFVVVLATLFITRKIVLRNAMKPDRTSDPGK